MGAHCQSKINYLKAMDLVKKKKNAMATLLQFRTLKCSSVVPLEERL